MGRIEFGPPGEGEPGRVVSLSDASQIRHLGYKLEATEQLVEAQREELARLRAQIAAIRLAAREAVTQGAVPEGEQEVGGLIRVSATWLRAAHEALRLAADLGGES